MATNRSPGVCTVHHSCRENSAAQHHVSYTAGHANHVLESAGVSASQVSLSADRRWLFGRNKGGSSTSQPSSPAAASASPAELGTPRHDLASIEETPGTAARPVEHLHEVMPPDSDVFAPAREPARAETGPSEPLWSAAGTLQHGSVVLAPSTGPDRADDSAAELIGGLKAAASAQVRDGLEERVSPGVGSGSRQALDRQQQAARATPPLLRWAAVPSVPSPVAARQQAASYGEERSTMARGTEADPHEAAAAFGSMVAATDRAHKRWNQTEEFLDSRDGQPASPVAHAEALMETSAVLMDPDQESVRGRDPGSASEPPAPLLSGSPTTDRNDAGGNTEEDSLPPPNGPLALAAGLQRRPKSAPAGTATVSTQSIQRPVAESSAQTSTARLSALQRLKQRASRRQAAALSSSVELAQHTSAPQPAQADPVAEDNPTALVSAAATRFGAWLQVRLPDHQYTLHVHHCRRCCMMSRAAAQSLL